MQELGKAREALAAHHRAEMAERERAYAAYLALRRPAQLEQVAGLLLHLVEVARAEYLDPPESRQPISGGC
jgi:hypothetical protein